MIPQQKSAPVILQFEIGGIEELYNVYSGRPVVFENKKRTKCTHKKYIIYTKFIENVHKMYTKNVYCKYNTIKV